MTLVCDTETPNNSSDWKMYEPPELSSESTNSYYFRAGSKAKQAAD